MKDWQFNVLFAVAVLGTLFLLIAPAVDALDMIPKNPTAVGGIGLILTFVLQQKWKNGSNNNNNSNNDSKTKGGEGE